MIGSERQASQTSDAALTDALRSRGSLIAGALLLAFGIAGFASTIRYEHVEPALAPLSPVGAISVRESTAADLDSLVANLVPSAILAVEPPIEAQGAVELSTAEAAQPGPQPNVVAAAANTVTLLPAPTATSTPSPTPTASPTPTVVPRPAGIQGTRAEGSDGPAVRYVNGSGIPIADAYGGGLPADEATAPMTPGSTVPRSDVPRDIYPTRPMPR